MFHRILPGTVLLLLLLGPWLPLGAMATESNKIEPLVLEEMAANGQADFFVWLAERADLTPADQLQSKEEKGRYVYETLRATAERSQAPLRAYLDAQEVDYRAFYIANKILVRGGDEALLLAIAGRPDVAQVTANHQSQLDRPAFVPSTSSPQGVEPNIAFIRADWAWGMGITGQGTVLSGIDTGMDAAHPALTRHYRGCLDPPTCSVWNHNYNWWDATGTYPDGPGDGNGHGTHTTGTMVGDDGAGNKIGVAPGAQMIHCKAMRDDGGASEYWFEECFEWTLAPWDLSGQSPRPDLAPDAVNNSWGYGLSVPWFRDEIAALLAAGIVVEAIAGNEGPACQTLRSPGDYWEVLTVGSVNHASPYPGTLSSFSSRGPSELPEPKSMYWFPDVMAPGQNVRSSWPGGGYVSGQGTSMAGPHVTALVGLCWSAAPILHGQVQLTMDLIAGTAVPLTGQFGSSCGGDYVEGPNHDWGNGTVDAFALVQACIAAGAGDFSLTLEPGSLNACRPSIVTATVTVEPVNNYLQPVALSDSGVPAGVQTAFTANPVDPLPGRSTYIITVTADAPTGTYALVVTGDTPTRTHSATLTLTVRDCCEPVQDAGFAWAPVTPTVGEVVVLTGTATGTLPISYTWDLGDGSPPRAGGTGGGITHTYTAPGGYVVVLTATNCATATATAMHTITVLPEPCEPVQDVAFDWTPLSPWAGQVVTFTASATGTAPITYSWKLEVGSWKTGPVVTYSYALPGDYNILLTATNCLTATAQASAVITILPEPGEFYYTYLPLVAREAQHLARGTAASILPIAAVLPPSPNWATTGENPLDSFGIWVAAAGDVNGDGYDDTIVGAPGYPNGGFYGKAYLYSGSLSGLSPTPSWSATGEVSYDYFGRAVATAGDVNGDGYDDVIVGARGHNGFQGKAYVYYGSPAGLSPFPGWTTVGEGSNNQYGTAVATAGDVNGDGYDDIIVGAYGYSGGRGKVYVYHGSPSGLQLAPNWVTVGENGGDNLGIAVATAGDVNSDGYDDIVLAAWDYGTAQGKVYVCHGSATGLRASPNWVAVGENSNDYFGRAVASAGDVNGDGYDDVVVTAHNYPNTGARGKAYLYHGSPAGLSVYPNWTAVGEYETDRLGRSAGSGDINGDGYSDIILGAYYYPNGNRRGKAYVYCGSAAGLGDSPAWTATGENEGDFFGESVAVAGNVNGDCFDDVVVGAYGYAAGSIQGKAYAYYGVVAGILAEPPTDAQGGAPGETVTYTLRVTNTGSCTDTFDVQVTASWTTTAPATAGPLAAGISDNLPVAVEIPTGANHGDWDLASITLTSRGDGNVTASSLLTTTAMVLCTPVRSVTFAWTPITPTAGAWVSFHGAASGSSPITYAWNFGDGGRGSGANISHRYIAAGLYTVAMSATNCGGESASVTHALTVLPEPPPPCEPVHDADFGWTPVMPTVGEIAVFTGTATGTLPITYTWKLDLQIWKAGQVVTYSYMLPGDYDVILTATNCLTATAQASTVLTVLPPPGEHYFVYLPLVSRAP